MSEQVLTGRKVFIITASAFAVIIGVNLTLAFQAVRTFPGLETKNSYVASQVFDSERAAQEALGWQVAARYDAEQLVLSFQDANGQPVALTELSAILGRATHVADDRDPQFQWTGREYVSTGELAPGNWNLRVEAVAPDGTAFRQRIPFYIKRKR